MNVIKDFFRLNFYSKSFIFFYIYFLIRLHFKSGLQFQTLELQNISIILLGIISILSLSKIIELLTLKNRLSSTLLKIISIGLYLGMSYYHLRSRVLLDYAVIADNAGMSLYAESYDVIIGSFKRKDIVITISIMIILLVVELFTRKLSKITTYKNRTMLFLFSIIVYVTIMFFSPYSYDEFTAYGQSIIRYYKKDEDFNFSSKLKVKYPYIKDFKSTFMPEEKDRPNIFIIMIESFNYNYVNKKNEKGMEYTPFFNSLKNEGLNFTNFWGTSVQTARGQLSVICSIPPITRKKIFTHYPDTLLNCLPKILNEYDYETMFFKAFVDMKFDNTGTFAKNIGFRHVHGMSEPFKAKYHKGKIPYWGWGIQDNYFYKIFFKYVDQEYKKKKSKVFAALTTVSNHQKFNKVPKKFRYLYPNQKNIKEAYANSIRISDEYLKEFFVQLKKRKYLENSIIIVTGDHSFPMGEHYSYAAENGFYRENFQVPFVMIWKKDSRFHGVNEKSFSQLDIAPTIMDILGIDRRIHFQGKSFFNDEKSRFIPLVQPYAGNFIGSVIYPYKYIYHKQTSREYLYNLKDDPKEQNNIIDKYKNHSLYQSFQSDLRKIYLNDYLVINNLIWDDGGL